MSKETDITLEQSTVSSPGGRLLQAREQLGMTHKSVADELYLPRNYIAWIEEGAYEKLPSMVFCRGYIRAYAKVVGENGEELVAILDGIYGNDNIKKPLSSVSKINEQVKVGDPVMKWSTIFFVLVLCGAVFWWWKTQYGLVVPFSTSQDAIAVETATGDEYVLPSLDDGLPNQAADSDVLVNTNDGDVVLEGVDVLDSNVPFDISDSVNGGEGIELSLNVQDTESTETTSELAELEEVVRELDAEPSEEQNVSTTILDETVQSAQAQLLRIEFNNECWVTIKDGRGKTIFNGIKKSGEQLAVSGDVPLKVSIGRVNSVSDITFNGQKIDLIPLSRNNIANFNLPL